MGWAENASILLDRIESGLAFSLFSDALTESLARHADALAEGARERLRIAGLKVACVEKVDYVGGSSPISLVSKTMKTQFPQALHFFSKVFKAVADGLAIADGQLDEVRLLRWDKLKREDRFNAKTLVEARERSRFFARQEKKSLAVKARLDGKG